MLWLPFGFRQEFLVALPTCRYPKGRRNSSCGTEDTVCTYFGSQVLSTLTITISKEVSTRSEPFIIKSSYSRYKLFSVVAHS